MPLFLCILLFWFLDGCFLGSFFSVAAPSDGGGGGGGIRGNGGWSACDSNTGDGGRSRGEVKVVAAMAVVVVMAVEEGVVVAVMKVAFLLYFLSISHDLCCLCISF